MSLVIGLLTGILSIFINQIENKKNTVEVDGLKAGNTEIEVCYYNYPNIKQIVSVNVVE